MENEKKMAKLETDLLNIKELLLDIKGEIKGMNQAYVPRSEVNEMFRSRDERISKLETNANSSKQLLVSWLAVIVAIAAVILPFIK